MAVGGVLCLHTRGKVVETSKSGYGGYLYRKVCLRPAGLLSVSARSEDGGRRHHRDPGACGTATRQVRVQGVHGGGGRGGGQRERAFVRRENGGQALWWNR